MTTSLEDANSTVLMVCTANQARSPLAAALFRRELDRRGLAEQVVVASAGLQVDSDHAALPEAVAAGAALGLRLEQHRARQVSDEELETADLIISFTEAHRHDLNRRSRGAVHRSFTLLELDRLLRADVPSSEVAANGLSASTARLSQLRPWTERPQTPEDVIDPARDPANLVPKIAAQLGEIVPRVVDRLFTTPVRR